MISRTWGTYAVLLERLGVLAVREHGSGVGELSKTRDREVLFVAALADDLVLRLQGTYLVVSKRCSRKRRKEPRTHGKDGGQDIGLSVSVAVSADAEVDLLRVGVTLECLGDACTRSRVSLACLKAAAKVEAGERVGENEQVAWIQAE